MRFSSPIWILNFLPVVPVFFYALVQVRRANTAITSLIVASLVFYAWWKLAHLPLLVISTVCNFLGGRVLTRSQREDSRKAPLAVGVSANLAALAYLKYADFTIVTLQTLTGWNLRLALVVLPWALSFFTFTQIAYLVEMDRGKVSRGSGELRDFVRWCPAQQVVVIATYPNTLDFPANDDPGALQTFAQNKDFYGSVRVPVAGTPRAFMNDRDSFFDSTYHLTQPGVTQGTNQLVPYIKPYLIRSVVADQTPRGSPTDTTSPTNLNHFSTTPQADQLMIS